MINRLIRLPKAHSFFLFGPRQTGKSTLLESEYSAEHALFYDLLKSEEYLRLSANPSLFREEVLSRDKKYTHVVIDEVQRVPALLNEVHHILEHAKPPYFVMSGSSARKLKKSHANLLAGRAWSYYLHPLTRTELGSRFSLDRALSLGTLPSVYLSSNDQDAQRTLKAYVETYLKEEIEQEAMLRNLGAFIRFLTLAGDENGNVINYSNIARETGVSYQTVKEYFKILEDTLVGFMLEPYSRSTRKRLLKHPKFYFFDTGVQRALTKKMLSPLERKTSDYGKVFEHFFIAEARRLASYREMDYRFSFYESSNHAEVDLIIETPQNRVFAVEIKSSENPDIANLKGLKSFQEVCPKATLYCACLSSRKRTLNNIHILPWQEVFQGLGLADE